MNATTLAELEALSHRELLDEYERLYDCRPRSSDPGDLARRIAWKLWEQRHPLGRSSEPDDLLSTLPRRLPPSRARPTRVGRGSPTPGTTLVRVWRNQEVRVYVRDDGRFEHDGEVYRSLSAVANAVTGSHWNGRAFFGLARRGRKS